MAQDNLINYNYDIARAICSSVSVEILDCIELLSTVRSESPSYFGC